MKIHKIITPVIFGATAIVIAASAGLQFIAPRGNVTPAGALNAVGGELDITGSQSAGIKLMSEKIAPGDYAGYGIDPQAASAYTLTATVLPEDATYKALDWSLAWNQTATDADGNNMYTDNSWYYYEIVNETEDDSFDLCTYELAGYGITEYDFLTITPNVDGGNVLTITCKQEFACPINITCTARDGSGVSATCKVDLAIKAKGLNISGVNRITLRETGSIQPVNYYVQQTIGTVTPATVRTAKYTVSTCNDWGTVILDNDISVQLPYGYAWTSDQSLAGYDDKEVTGNPIFTYSTTWDIFCDTFIVKQNPSLTENQKRANRDAARQMLQELKNKGVLNTLPIFRVDITLTDSYTGQTFLASKDFYLTDISKIPVYTTNVSDIELPDSIVL